MSACVMISDINYGVTISLEKINLLREKKHCAIISDIHWFICVHFITDPVGLRVRIGAKLRF